MIENDDGGDDLHSLVSTRCSYRPPPKAAAREKQRSISDHWARTGFMCLSVLRPSTTMGAFAAGNLRFAGGG
jgi:hypothetical protein